MHLHKRAAVLSWVLVSGLYGPIAAQEEPIELPDYEVRSSPFSQSLALGTNQLQTHAPVDLAHVLRSEMPDVSIIRKAGTSNDVALRGLSQDNLSVTIDGQKVFCACSNRMDPPASQVAIGEISRIEVTHGAFDLSHAGALGGSINIETRMPAVGTQFMGTMSFGSHDFIQAAVEAGGGNSTLAGLLAASYEESGQYEDGSGRVLTDFTMSNDWLFDDYQDRYRDDLAYRAAHGSAKIQWSPWDGLEGRATLNYRLREDWDVLYPGLRMDADSTRTQEFSLAWNQNELSTPWADSWSWRIYHNWTDHDMRDTRRLSALLLPNGMNRPAYVLERGWFMESLGRASASGFRFQAEVETLQWNHEYGSELVLRQWDLDNRLGAGMSNAGPAAEVFNSMIPDVESTVAGIWWQGTRKVGDRANLELGARVDHFHTSPRDSVSYLALRAGPRAAESRSETAPAAKAVLHLYPRENTSLYMGIGTIARIPNAQERYIQLQRPGTNPDWLGNAALDAPRNTELALGFEHAEGPWSLRAKAFYSMLEDYIYPVRLTPADLPSLSKPTQSFTAIDAELLGWDLGTSLRLHETVTLEGAFAWQRGSKKDRPANNNNDYLAEIPPYSAHLNLTYYRDRLTLRTHLRLAGSQDRIDASLNEQQLDRYAVVDLHASWQLGEHLNLRVGVNNVFDAAYASHNAIVRNPFSSFAVVPEPGRSVFATVSYQWL